MEILGGGAPPCHRRPLPLLTPEYVLWRVSRASLTTTIKLCQTINSLIQIKKCEKLMSSLREDTHKKSGFLSGRTNKVCPLP